MPELLNSKRETIKRPHTVVPVNPLPFSFVREYISLQEELEQVKQRLFELESKIPEEKTIVLRNITKKEAKKEIRELFLTGRTLYYSDIAEELRLDLKLVVDICRQFQESKEIGVDKDALARIS